MSKEYEELKAEITALKAEVAKLNSKMIYNYVDNNMPEWARPTIQKMMDKETVPWVDDPTMRQRISHSAMRGQRKLPCIL